MSSTQWSVIIAHGSDHSSVLYIHCPKKKMNLRRVHLKYKLGIHCPKKLRIDRGRDQVDVYTVPRIL